MTQLFVIADQYKQLIQTLADGDFDAATIADTIEASGIADDFNAKALNVALVAKSLVQHVPTIDAEIERLTALKTRATRNSDGLISYVKQNMESLGISEIKTPLFTLKIINNPGSVEILNPDIPAEYLSEQKPAPPRTPDKKKIADALKAGEPLTFARLVQSTRLKIG